jgi:hypothetical protein
MGSFAYPVMGIAQPIVQAEARGVRRAGWNTWSLISGILFMEFPKADKYEKTDQRYADHGNESRQDPSLRLLRDNAVEDVTESS